MRRPARCSANPCPPNSTPYGAGSGKSGRTTTKNPAKLEEVEAEIPALDGRVKTVLAYLQRAYYIQYRSGVGEEGIEPILYDVYEPR